MYFQGFAPRFVGEFREGRRLQGDAGHRDSVVEHAVIARPGGYTISVHSGSDKFYILPMIARPDRRAAST